MAKNVCIPFFTGSDHITGQVTGAPVVGKTFVKYVAGGKVGLPNISTAAPGDIPNAVAAHDGAVGEAVHIITDAHLPITAEVELIVGDRVKVGTAGKATKIGAGEENLAVGTVYVGAVAGADAAVRINL